MDVALQRGETTIGVAWRTMRTLGVESQILDCFIDQTPPPDGSSGIVPAVIELAALDALPPGTRWVPIESVEPTTVQGLAGYVADRLDEWRGRRAVPDERSPWCRRGWNERVGEWIDGVLAARGEGPAVAVSPFRHWGISAVQRVETEHARYWFKAVFAPFAAEPVVTEFLHRTRPGKVTTVIAVETSERWMLMAEIDGTTAAVDADATRAAIAALVDLQRSFIGHTDTLQSAGFEHRPIHMLPIDLASALGRPLVRAAVPVAAERLDALSTWLAEAVVVVERLGIPHTLVHGDFHPGNVMHTDDGVVLFDWSDAAVSHPLIDVAVWASWSNDDPAAIDELWRTFAAEWSPEADPTAVVAARLALDAITGAYHFVSYARVLEGLEPNRRPEALGGLTGFFEQLDRTTPH
jgi:hypothetical protein